MNNNLNQANRENQNMPKPGYGGLGAIFLCSQCGDKFVRTYYNQVKCLACSRDEQRQYTEIERISK